VGHCIAHSLFRIARNENNEDVCNTFEIQRGVFIVEQRKGRKRIT
jgi:hypothetical protein